MTERRGTEFEIEVPATPEEVWDAIATGPGIGAWFVPSEVDGRPGGEVVFHLGPGMDAPATVTGWEPPSRFAYEEQDADGRTLGTEFLAEARAGGTCVVRLVSTFSAGYSDEEIEGMGSGWSAFVDNLRMDLTHFAGQAPAAMSVTAMSGEPKEATWARLRAALEGDDAPALGWGDQTVADRPPERLRPRRRRHGGPRAAAWNAWLERHVAAAA